MALLETIRKRPGLMVGFVGIALAAFVIGDAIQNGNTWFSANQRVALAIDGDKVNIEDYGQRLNALTEQMQQQQGQLSDEQRMNINNSLAQQIIADHVLKELAAKVGVRVTPDEVYALLHSGQGVTPSPLAQQFFAGLGIDINDAQGVKNFIDQISDANIKKLPQEQQTAYLNIQTQWKKLQEQIVTNRLQQKLSTLLARSYKVTQLDQNLAVAGGTRTVALVRSTPLAGSDKADQPTDEEIKKYYDAHSSLFLMQSPSAQLSYIAAHVTPSSADYKAAEEQANKVYGELQNATTANVASVVRNLGGSFNQVYLTGAELDQMGLGDAEVNFIKSAEAGATFNSGLVNDKYSILKLVAKKTAPEALGLKVILLDSVSGLKSDSLLTALKGGASFDEMVAKYSQDPQSKADSGRLSQPGQYGMPMNTFTEAQLAGSLFAEAYNKPVGEPFVVNNGTAKLIMKTVDAKPATVKYQLAVVSVDASFSEKTYNAKYDALNQILGAGGSFEDMIKKAEREGFSVVKSEAVNTSSVQLGAIPSSRQVIQWALNADDKTITDKVYRLGSDYLVIAQVLKHYEAGLAPLEVVKEGIVAALSAEKRAKNLADKLSKKGLSSLEAYATELNAQIDTISGVNYFVRGSEAAAFNGKAMTTAIGQLSKPFVAGNEVMVLKPTETTAPDQNAVIAQARQAEQGLGYQLANRAFQNLLQKTKIEDNRARFY